MTIGESLFFLAGYLGNDLAALLVYDLDLIEMTRVIENVAGLKALVLGVIPLVFGNDLDSVAVSPALFDCGMLSFRSSATPLVD